MRKNIFQTRHLSVFLYNRDFILSLESIKNVLNIENTYNYLISNYKLSE